MRMGGRHIRTNSAPRTSLRSLNRMRNTHPPTAVRHPELSSYSQPSSLRAHAGGHAPVISIPRACCEACKPGRATHRFITSFRQFAYELRSTDGRDYFVPVLINSVNLSSVYIRAQNNVSLILVQHNPALAFRLFAQCRRDRQHATTMEDAIVIKTLVIHLDA